jgi:hypothetical protein
MNEESILGLLLRALRQSAQQEYGEEYKQSNLNGSVYYGQCCQNIISAIQALFLAERTVGYSDGRKAFQKETSKPE